MTEAVAVGRAESDPKRWWALALLCSAYFMVILDVSIVNVALPSIQKDLHFSQGDLQWVLSAYALTFGGFLLLGGRAADLLGRRRVFMAGVALFTAASLACGLSNSEGMLIAARAVQGLGAAILSPAALSIISTTFAEGSERNKALGIWGAMGGSGAAVGVLMGGVLTKWLGWEWIFFVNIPVGVTVLLLVRSVVRESRAEHAVRQYDALGAVLITSALVLLVYALTRANVNGWGSAETIGVLAVSAVLHIAFVVVEQRSKAPLVPLGIFARLRTLTGANVVAFLLGGLTFAMFFMLSLYMQQVLGMSALQAGAGYLAVALTAIVSAGVAQATVTKIGIKPAMMFGLALMTLGNVWFTQVSADGSYAVDLLPGFFAIGIGLGFSFVPVSIAALAGVAPQEAGLASGLFNTSQQIGGALGVALFSTVSTNRTQHLLAEGESRAQALTSGFSLSFWVAVGFGVAALLAALLMVHGEELATAPAEA
ncbi:MAG TPA: MFS transporter [Gaiellaceae bacterium]|nr:MFS transporter [Gaiellaceae bacterium]